MPLPRISVPAAAPVAEIERRIQWRAASALVFLGILASLAGLAIMPLISPPMVSHGLPDDPDVKAAAGLVQNRLCANAGDLQFYSSLLGDEGAGHPFTTGDEGTVARSEGLLKRALSHHPGDARITTSLATLEFVRGKLAHAERGYRSALDRASWCGEARLALGVLLALRAEHEATSMTRRGLELQAIAQFAAIGQGDPALGAALYNRALLLTRVGRPDEARRVAALALARDPHGSWSESLRRAVGLAGR